MRPSAILVFLVCLVIVPSRVHAQIDDTTWGITGGVSPQWSIPGDWLAELFDATSLDVKGPEFRVGVIRGTTNGGEWGVSLIHKRLSKESEFEIEGTHNTLRVVADDAEMIGVEVHRFFPFARTGRVQIGVNLGGGIAQLRGFVSGVQVGPTSTNFALPFQRPSSWLAMKSTGFHSDVLNLVRQP